MDEGRHVIDDVMAWLTAASSWEGANGIPTRVWEHMLYTLVTLAIALVLAAPLGAWVGHTGRARWLVTGANAVRAVPSLGLLFAVSMFVGPMIQSSLAFVIPSIVVLVLLAIPPILSGTYAGIESVDPAARDAAHGMGMTGREVLTKVELPIALPLFLSGLRSAALQVIATATIAASVSLGGLGRYLIDGLAAREYAQMVGGSIIVALLALLADGLLELVERYAVSPGISGRSVRVAPRSEERPGTGLSAGPAGATASVGTTSERDRS